jgi:hypothetical protein
MDPINLEKLRAIKKYKSNQLLGNQFLYYLTVLTCGLFCCSPFWYPSLSSSMKVFLFSFLPNTCSALFSYKFAFIIGNLIVAVLIGQSKIFSSKPSQASDVLYHEYINRSRSLQSSSTIDVKSRGKTLICVEENVKRTEKDGEDTGAIRWAEAKEDLDGNNGFALPAEELFRRADDLIARVKRNRKLEARILL